MLTKPLGTGIVNTAIKGNLASGEITRKVTAIMAALNRTAATVMRRTRCMPVQISPDSGSSVIWPK